MLALDRRGRRELRRDRLGIVLPQPSENLLDHFDAAHNVRWAADQRHGRDSSAMSSADLDSLARLRRSRRCPCTVVFASCRAASNSDSLSPAPCRGPDLVILDEPTASLDRMNAQLLVDVLAAVASQGATMVVATHDPLVIEAGDVIAELDHGRRIR